MSVPAEGDLIMLDDNLGQRLSKMVKRGDPGPAAQLAIATKIFEMVDRKATAPKTRTATHKGVARAKQLMAEALTMTPEERRIVEAPHEILLIHSPDGRLKSVTLGNRNKVSIPADLEPGSILSHNHPSGRGPSDSDLKAVLSFPEMTLRVVSKNEDGNVEVFSMRFTGELKKAEIQGFSELYFDQCNDAGDTHAARRESLALISQLIGNSFQVLSRILQ